MDLVKLFFNSAINKRVNEGIAAKQSTAFVDAFSTAFSQANLVNRNLYRWIGDDWPILNEDGYDYVNNAYEAVGAVWECVSMISNKILECPKIVYEVKDEQKYKQYKNLSKSLNPIDRIKADTMKADVLEEVRVKEIEKLLNNPNPSQNGDEYDELRITLLLLTGNCYVYGNASEDRIKSKLWSELFALPDMHIVSGGLLEPVKAYYMFWNTDKQELFPVDQVKHIKTTNPNFTLTGTQLYGIAPLRRYLYELEALKNGNKQSNKQLKNGTEFGVVAPKNKEDQWTKDQKTDFKEHLSRAEGSTDFLSNWLPSSIPLDFLKMGLSAADMELLATMKVKAEDIYRCFHVPLFKRTMEHSALNNMREGGKQFIYDAVAPWATKLDAADTEFICDPYKKKFGKNYIIKRDITSLPELSADMKEMSEWLNNSPQLTLNEKREVMGFGKSTEPGMDRIVVPRTWATLQDVVDGKVTNTSPAQDQQASA